MLCSSKQLPATTPPRLWHLTLAGNRLSCQSQRGALSHSLHCACEFYTHTHPVTPPALSSPGGRIDCIAPASFTHPPAPGNLGLWRETPRIRRLSRHKEPCRDF